MANVKKALRVKDSDIVRLNYVGLPLKAIGEILGCHYATITNRMKAMNLAPVDTRRGFMEDIFKDLTPDQQDWLSNYLYNNQVSIKSFLSFLIQKAHAGAIELPVGEPLPLEESPAEPTEEVLADVSEEIVTEAEALPIVEPEYAHNEDEELSEDEISPLCSYCGECPEMDGQGICPGCLDAQENSPGAVVQADLEEEEESETLRTASLFR